MNACTLASFFPPNSLPSPDNNSPALTAVQALSLYLAAHRYDRTCTWAPYIRVLPIEFHDHPLNIVLTYRSSPENFPKELGPRYAALLSAPPTFLSLLYEATERCEHDIGAVTAYLARHADLFGLHGKVDVREIVWGWLNVNTRQVWMPLNLSKRDNITLAPIFDMCNHTAGSGGELKLSPAKRFVDLHVSYPLRKHDEVYIQYGPHSNAKLLVEYGFILPSRDCRIWEACVADLVSTMFEAEGKRGKEMLACLEQHGYLCRDFALHFQPEPAAPSYGLIVALRLLHSASTSEDYAGWFQVLWNGQFSERYPAADAHVSRSIYDLCTFLIERAEDALDALRHISGFNGQDVKALWQEELTVALAVETNLRSGLIEFD
ncbi:hypothetical protein CALVIDRAFT_336471 [Calocera viscosa TUFC12733]|uniref:SET domain-containing protein n=1 Tax=Calocera viscosa (strain TUFC12733) TaxID=1330018 RepID=A0A167HIN0_CALVF|nr:hypothetical protein CALVIDRAFT_336471 [Calocera viscosa TUFC12733]